MTKKEIAESFLKLASAGKVREAYEKYVHADFIHHNTYYKGDLVTVHGKVTLGHKVFGVIHIFRFENEKIVEEWEASQEVLQDSPNENGIF